mmetsp:Transcript_18145/g.41968  ORF Transcript_18145/g.41968 Transcript_18145/m.41968 type:complete len:137 (-) Transcript_18145:602-1012(-)
MRRFIRFGGHENSVLRQKSEALSHSICIVVATKHNASRFKWQQRHLGAQSPLGSTFATAFAANKNIMILSCPHRSFGTLPMILCVLSFGNQKVCGTYISMAYLHEKGGTQKEQKSATMKRVKIHKSPNSVVFCPLS